MKRILLSFIAISLFCITLPAQKKYEMVVEKTDGSETVFNVEDVVRTYFRELSGGGGGGQEVSYQKCPDNNHPHLIDLGLPSGTKWACCNVGAEKPEDYGGYFAWGETTEKSSYTSSNYLNGKGTNYNIGKDITGTQYDAATSNWGRPWVMPSLEQMNELTGKCYSEWVKVNGISGTRFTGPNGASIFLPAAGFRRDNNLVDVGNGLYWSSTLDESCPTDAWDLDFSDDYVATDYNDHRHYGHSVRPVIKN